MGRRMVHVSAPIINVPVLDSEGRPLYVERKVVKPGITYRRKELRRHELRRLQKQFPELDTSGVDTRKRFEHLLSSC